MTEALRSLTADPASDVAITGIRHRTNRTAFKTSKSVDSYFLIRIQNSLPARRFRFLATTMFHGNNTEKIYGCPGF